jgi:hypothetical protein
MEHDVKPKIFPRNLTAHAREMVTGNPVVSRPESGADNSHPGLELDQRTLDRGFFPGLLFDFQYGVGARLVEVQDTWPDMKADFAASRKVADGKGELFLWYVFGIFGDEPTKLTKAELYGLDGYDVLRKVHDLEPGPLAIVVGRHPEHLDVGSFKIWMPAIQQLMKEFGPLLSDDSSSKPLDLANMKIESKSVAFPDGDGNLQFALLIAKRAPYLNDDGVIELSTVEPGGLTRSLCSPWQWDFADCGCYYWAASRPDIVTGEKAELGDPGLNYLRRRDQPLPAAENQQTEKQRTWEGWMNGVMNGADMILKWETLPLVINDRENRGTIALKPPKGACKKKDAWDKERVICELQHLAKIEHTLCVKFLYAYYSVNAPAGEPPPNASAREIARSKVAHEVRKIAIDEMRHFRWVNEALYLLGKPSVVGRASKLRRAEAEGTEIIGPQVSLKLEGLTPAALDRFIEIERPTDKKDQDEVASLYKNVLLGLQHGAGDYVKDGKDVREQLQELVKLIIDEGRDHYLRALHARELLKGDKPACYLRYDKAPDRHSQETEAGQLQRLGDHYYRSVIQILELAFLQDPDERASMLKQTRRVMHNLDEVGHALGDEHRAALLFTAPRQKRPPDAAAAQGGRPVPPPGPLPLATSVPHVLATLRGSGSRRVAEIARRHAQEASDLVHVFDITRKNAKGT